MRNYLSVFIIFFIFLTFTSCGLFVKKVSFTKEELQWFNVYNVKDTLIFQSLSTQIKDTSIIVSKELYHDYDWFRHDKKGHCMDLTYYNKKYKYADYNRKTETMFFYCKRDFYDKNPYYLGLTYLRSSFKIDSTTVIKDLEILSLSNKSFKNVYELKCRRMKYHGGTDDDPEILYWDKKYGIIKYITFNGEIWERINW
ncbi:hypothetical protein [Flavobacterium sp.]|jgi:hypothetical protein|uniref:hypothetical protein n=1 Tax=Flavobacterium sp. TaxID=239 RepID=UPI0022BB0C58|nr:hypothetical protein [Flavobacterium sp.]MCZ8297762.1 hypothetical protein [Flavobacterium sp.]